MPRLLPIITALLIAPQAPADLLETDASALILDHLEGIALDPTNTAIRVSGEDRTYTSPLPVPFTFDSGLGIATGIHDTAASLTPHADWYSTYSGSLVLIDVKTGRSIDSINVGNHEAVGDQRQALHTTLIPVFTPTTVVLWDTITKTRHTTIPIPPAARPFDITGGNWYLRPGGDPDLLAHWIFLVTHPSEAYHEFTADASIVLRHETSGFADWQDIAADPTNAHLYLCSDGGGIGFAVRIPFTPIRAPAPSPQLAFAPAPDPADLHITCTVLPGWPHTLQTSLTPDPATFLPVATITPTEKTTHTFHHPNAATAPRRFYRLHITDPP